MLSMGSDLTEEFLRTLHEEKSDTMTERSKYARDKIVFILGIMGFGSLNFSFSGVNSVTILYLVPLVAFGYDLYIDAYDEGIKRIGAFLRSQSSMSSESEKNYERYVRIRRGKYASIANVLFSLVGTAGAGFIVFLESGFSLPLWWFAGWSGMIIGMSFMHRKQASTYDHDDVDQELKNTLSQNR